MDNTPAEAPAEAPKASESEATPTTNQDSTQATPNLHGFTEAQLAEMEKFYSANGGYEKAFNRVKSAISNPTKPVEKAVENSQAQPQKTEEPTSHTQEPAQMQVPQTPQGAITAQEFLAKQYFKSLAGEEKYAPIAKGIENGDYLKEMAAFGINALNQDGSINDQKVRMYLDLKAQTVPAKPTESEPNASAAPTVSYTEVGENGFTDINQAYKVLMEKGNPNMAKAEEFIRNHFNPNAGKK